MQALQCNGKLGQVRLVEVEIPFPALHSDDEVLLRVSHAGICGTDLHILSGDFSNCSDEFITMSHEFSGVVEEVGPKAAGKFKKGDRVAVDPNRPCHQCRFCRSGRVNFCQDGGITDAVGIFRDGGVAAYCSVPAEQVYKLPDHLSLEQGVLCEPLSCVIHGWDRLNDTGNIHPESRVLIAGAGIIGNLWASLLHHYGYRHVTISEPNHSRQEITKNLGTGFAILRPDELLEQERPKNTDVEGFDIVIDCTGHPAALEQAVGLAAKGGVILVFGCAGPNKSAHIFPEMIFRKELVIMGCLVNPFTFSRAVTLAAAMGKRYLCYDKLGIKVYSIQEFESAFQSQKLGEISKAVFKLS